MCTFWSNEHPDAKMDEMAQEFCAIAHLESHDTPEEKKKCLDKEFKKAAKHVQNIQEKEYGKEGLLEEYREIYKDTKGNPDVGTAEDKITIGNMDKCVQSGELFYVSIQYTLFTFKLCAGMLRSCKRRCYIEISIQVSWY